MVNMFMLNTSCVYDFVKLYLISNYVNIEYLLLNYGFVCFRM